MGRMASSCPPCQGSESCFWRGKEYLGIKLHGCSPDCFTPWNTHEDHVSQVGSTVYQWVGHIYRVDVCVGNTVQEHTAVFRDRGEELCVTLYQADIPFWVFFLVAIVGFFGLWGRVLLYSLGEWLILVVNGTHLGRGRHSWTVSIRSACGSVCRAFSG